jgi:quercetin dioxygenase-like cupin family protein
MKKTHGIAVAAVIVGTSLGVHVARAQQSGITRTDLQQHDLSIAGREVVQVRVDLSPEVAFGRHSHPGEEIVYVLEGSLEYEVDGKPPVTLKAGGVLFIPAGTIHSAKNVGSGNGAELAKYLVDKEKPLVMIGKRATADHTKVSSIPSSDRSQAARLVSCLPRRTA